ncbi:MAG: hypothetical protein JWM77_2622 [Rhodospirillales bacterium]|nr:hypothetical protein [Rhodospirillales bacterium]
MTELRRAMPILARCEGVWDGLHQHFSASGKRIDQHRVRNVGRFTDDPEFPWLETSTSFWDDGRSRHIEYRCTHRDGRLWFDNEWAVGWCREIEADARATALLIYWQWKAPDAWLGRPTRDLHIYQWLQISPDGQRRNGVVQWLDDGRLVLRSLVDVTLLTRDWRSNETLVPTREDR